MNRNPNPVNGVKLLLSYLFGFVLAFIGPILTVSEFLSFSPMVMLSSVGMVFLMSYAGRGPAIFSMMMQLLFNAMFMGSIGMWIGMFASVLPALTVIRNFTAGKPFPVQMRSAVGKYILGTVGGVLVVNLFMGENVIPRLFAQLSTVMREVPAEQLAALDETLHLIYGNEMTSESFVALFENTMNSLAPMYQTRLPGMLFGGAIITAVIGVTIANLLASHRGTAPKNSYLPLAQWALPAQTTSGLLMMLSISYLLLLLEMKNASSVNFAVLEIAKWIFCLQAMGSIRRRLQNSGFKKPAQTLFMVLIYMLLILGYADYLAIYGVCSAIFGSRGALKQRIERNDNHKA